MSTCQKIVICDFYNPHLLLHSCFKCFLHILWPNPVILKHFRDQISEARQTPRWVCYKTCCTLGEYFFRTWLNISFCLLRFILLFSENMHLTPFNYLLHHFKWHEQIKFLSLLCRTVTEKLSHQ